MLSTKWLVFIGAAMAIMMVDIDMTAVNLAITNISSELDMDISGGQWIINGYSMAAAVLMAFAGRLGDSYGHKRVFLGGVFVFTFASLAVALSQGFWSITLARIAQGACIAFTFPMGSVFVREVFPDEQKGLAISLLISVAGISQALGPTFGGAMVSYLSWHWIFLINIPLAILSFLLIWTFLKEPVPDHPLQLHSSSLISLIVGLFALMTALNEVNQFGIWSIPFLGLMLLGILSMALFVYHELKLESPLLDIRILINKQFGSLITTRLLVNFVYFSWLFGLGIILQKGLGYDAFVAGIIMLSMTLTITVLSAPVGKWIDSYTFKPPLISGLILMFIACIMMAWTNALSHIGYLLISLVLAGCSASFLIPSTASGTFSLVKPEKAGVAMGVFFTCGFLGNSIGVAISGSIMDEHTIMTGYSYAMLLCASLIAFALCISISLPKRTG